MRRLYLWWRDDIPFIAALAIFMTITHLAAGLMVAGMEAVFG